MIPNASGAIDPPSADGPAPSSTRNDASTRSVDSNVDSNRLDLGRAVAIAAALEALVLAGITDQAKPIARELAAMLRAAEAAMTPRVISLPAARAARAKR